MKVLQNANEELQSITGGFELKLHGLSDQLKLKEHQIEHTLMNLRINPDCLNGRRSWMKNMGARSIGSDKSVQGHPRLKKNIIYVDVKWTSVELRW
jgi:hypothetical protein